MCDLSRSTDEGADGAVCAAYLVGRGGSAMNAEQDTNSAQLDAAYAECDRVRDRHQHRRSDQYRMARPDRDLLRLALPEPPRQLAPRVRPGRDRGKSDGRIRADAHALGTSCAQEICGRGIQAISGLPSGRCAQRQSSRSSPSSRSPSASAPTRRSSRWSIISSCGRSRCENRPGSRW